MVERKSVFGIMLMLLLAGMLTLAFNIQPVKAEPKTIRVPTDYPTIQEAINAANPGDTIYVYNGTYYEHLYIAKSNLTIIGENPNITIIDGSGARMAAVRIYYSSGVTLTGFTVRNVTKESQDWAYLCSCIILYRTMNIIIEDNVVSEAYIGIFVGQGRENNTIVGNTISNTELGIYLYYSDHNTIDGNTMSNTEMGIALNHSDDNTIVGNTMSNRTRTGIQFWGAYNNEVIDNTVANCEAFGIAVGEHASSNTFAGNNASNNGIGILVYDYSNNNMIINNNICSSIHYGIAILESNNTVYHNNFINNTQQVHSYTSVSTWDDGYPSGGNYWSDYAGVDANGDGIGDAPYVIDENNTDRYPLMHSWSPLPVHNINTGLGYATIQEAINATETLNGHAIFVETGTYYEHVTISKSIALIGEDKSSTIIDGGGTGTIVSVEADNVTVKGFTVLRGSHGIYLHDCSYNLIDENTITSNSYGILLSDAQSNNITGSEVTYNDFGIILYRSDENMVTKNIVTNNNYGIRLEYSCNNTLSYNNMTSNLFNFGVHGESLSHFVNSIDASNTVNNKLVYYFIQQRHIVINSSTFSNIGYLALINSADIQVEGVILANNFQGILLAYTNNSVIKKLDVLDNYYGVSLVYSNDNVITENTIANNLYFGISVGWNSGNNSIFHNNFVNNTIQAYGTPYANAWDDCYPSGGNYWSDYTGVDLYTGPSQDLHGSDGIGDTPYIIDANNKDRYPLMNPYGAPPPTTYTLTITATVGGTTDPAPGTYGYTVNSTVQVTAIPEAGYLFEYWELDDVNVGSANPYAVLMDKGHTLKAVFSSIPPPLSASISPLSASINVGESVTFTSTVSGGYTPYSYQWYLNGNPVSGANASSWTFTPTTSGIYYVYLKVTDAKGNTAQSETARITVAAVPVGGYSIPIQVHTKAEPIITYITLITILTAIFVEVKRKTKRKR